jgi:5-formyltetrahydrofolate cyclo-ligase
MPGEIATDSILKAILATGKRCYVPRYDVKSRRMDMLRLHSLSDLDSLPATKWGIKQPGLDDEGREDALATAGGLDLVLCPGLAFSPTRRRMGRGMGFYDGFLHR